MKIDYLAEMRRARFLFSFENKFTVERRRPVLRSQCIERRENRHHAGFVVRGGARIETPLGIDLAGRGKRNDLSAGFHRRGSPSWLKRRRCGPRFWIDRLTVV